MALTERQKRFVHEYMIDLNAKQAAIRAGYSERGAEVQGCQLLSNPNVAALIAERTAERAKVAKVSAEWVISRLVENVERCQQAEQVTDREGNPTGEYKFDAANANRALELLGKHLGLFVERRELTGAHGGPLQVDEVSLDDAERLRRITALVDRARARRA
jgi:phage terminase small subunit